MIMRDAVVEGSGNLDHLGFFTVHPNLSTRAYNISVSIENAAAAAWIRFRDLRTASSSVGSAESRQLYSVQLPSLTSASSGMAGSEEEALAVDSGGGRQLLKGYFAGSVASGSEADTMDSSTRAFLAVRRSRILGMPMTYYALLMASMVLCAFSYSYASRTSALLKAPLPQSSTRGQDLAYVTRHEHLPSVRVHGARRRSPARGRKSKRFGRHSPPASATAATTTVAADNVDSTWDSTSDSVSPATRQPLVMETTPSTVEATAATRSAPASLPPAVTPTGGDVPQNGTFNSSANLDEYEEVVEYYYMYDDNDTSASSMQRPTRYAELAIPINI
ncbi:hypothetical protein HPB51_022943 [Rhipicephalus microplus]|uniref:Transmembrane protein n=1 Tax=Rhipicephalus microplus TaxID=6941 RepID=A0A9J6DRF1_RHIMP|nr:hypothetical protein HPB51_022943 [Rhipicephalus microplus]